MPLDTARYFLEKLWLHNQDGAHADFESLSTDQGRALGAYLGTAGGMDKDTSRDVLVRLYRRNWDESSSDFQALTAVQAFALFVVLSQQHAAKGLGKSHNNNRLDLMVAVPEDIGV